MGDGQGLRVESSHLPDPFVPEHANRIGKVVRQTTTEREKALPLTRMQIILDKSTLPVTSHHGRDQVRFRGEVIVHGAD